MELLQLRYFRTAALMENFTNAAKHHRIPQSAISKTIRNLERELECELFIRNGKRITLSENGKLFLEKVDNALNSLDSGIEELKAHSLQIIGIRIHSGIHFVTELMTDYESEHRNSKVVNFHGAALKCQEEDFTFFQLPIDEDIYDYKVLMQDEIMLAVSKGSRLAGRKKIKLEDLKNEKFISYDSGNQLRRLTEALCAEKGFTPNIVFETATYEVLRSMVEAGVGISLVPSSSWNLKKSEHVVLIPLESKPCRQLAIAWKKAKNLTLGQKTFLDYTCGWFSRPGGP
ncbi:MAG: LysR family transcriptional regulator [Acetatifactor sp.]|nr:LysR family transcriptional regulator [Acetatifactor sp.]